MHSRHNPQAIIQKHTLTYGYINNPMYFNLPQDRILFFNQDKSSRTTYFSVFKMDNLDKPLAKLTLIGDYSVLCLFPDGSLLLNQKAIRGSLMKVSANLEIFSSQPWGIVPFACAIDIYHFFLMDILRKKVVIYKFHQTQFIQSSEFVLDIPDSCWQYMSDIQSLGHNTYCCSIRDYHLQKFQVLGFNISPITHQIKTLHTLTSKYQDWGAAATGESAILNNGNLLIYHKNSDYLQIWNIKTNQCVEHLHWNDMYKPTAFKPIGMKIIPSPFSRYWFVFQMENLFILDKHTLFLKHIALDKKLKLITNHHMLPNGLLFAFTQNINDYECMVQIDLKEMITLRKSTEKTKESQYLAGLFFNLQGLPIEIVNHIFSYAFTEEALDALAEKIEIEERTCCIL